MKTETNGSRRRLIAPTVRLCVRAASAAIIAAIAIGLSGCGSKSLTAGLDGSELAHDFATIGVYPGEQAVFSSELVNKSGRTVTLRSAALLPLAHMLEPRLYIVAVETGREYVTSARGWPVPGVESRSLAGYVLRNGQSVYLPFAVTQTRYGNYAVGGLKIKFTADGRSAYVNLTSPDGACVIVKRGRMQACPDSFQNELSAIIDN